jgi:hypothetical protein
LKQQAVACRARLDGGTALATAQDLVAPGELQVRHGRLVAMTGKATLLEDRGGFGVQRLTLRSGCCECGASQ